MAIKKCSLLFAIFVFGNIEYSVAEAHAPVDITVVSGVDEKGQENIASGKNYAHASSRVTFGKGDDQKFNEEFNNNFGEQFNHNFITNFDHDFVKFHHDFNKNFNKDFGRDLTKSLHHDTDHFSDGYSKNNVDKEFGQEFDKNIDQHYAADNSQGNLHGNPQFIDQTNRLALAAANKISNKNGFPFEYRPPGPEFAFATGAINPQQTYIKTEINEPNHGYIFNRFQDDDDDDTEKKTDTPTNATQEEGSKKPSNLEANNSTTSAPAQEKPKPKRKPIRIPQLTVLSNKKEVKAGLDNRFSGDEEEGNPNKKVKTIVHSSADGKPLYRTTVVTKKGPEASIGNRFASEDEEQPKYDSVQTFTTTDLEGKKLYETEVYISKVEPSLNSRFGEDAISDKEHSFHTFVTGLNAANIADKTDAKRAEIVTSKNGIVKRIVSKEF